ncbi:antA/AntB antirepressor family protein [Pseudomonas atacamensis]|uniref:antA/AntB antirepressor family protein n=1 Tax=Pseudomonas atacamensis TaxID=2565368 RepID=UPI001FAC51E2|nr:antA/AntB antirepressor family protein [Pseudomonas atacamensis]MCI9874470.1 antA/AntB antirepressor family protein [Pseudomonas atacamensis]
MSLTTLITSHDTGSSASSHLRCSARNLHAFLQVGRRFNGWINGRIETYGFEEGQDFFIVSSQRERFDNPDRGNQTPGAESVDLIPKRGGDRRSTDYLLTLDMAKELAMIENSVIGRQVRRYFIEREQQLIAILEERASRILPLPGVTRSARDGINFKQLLILQEQGRNLARWLDAATGSFERHGLHNQLRQVNDALGLPTPPLEPDPLVLQRD